LCTQLSISFRPQSSSCLLLSVLFAVASSVTTCKADAGVDADVLEESSYAKALHKALQASPHASASEPPSSDGNEAAAGSETGAGAVDAERTASAALRAPSDPYLLGADAADADAADVTASSSRATEVAAAEAAAEAAAARCGWDEATILLNDLHKVYPPPLFASGGASAKHAVKGNAYP